MSLKCLSQVGGADEDMEGEMDEAARTPLPDEEEEEEEEEEIAFGVRHIFQPKDCFLLLFRNKNIPALAHCRFLRKLFCR